MTTQERETAHLAALAAALHTSPFHLNRMGAADERQRDLNRGVRLDRQTNRAVPKGYERQIPRID